MDPERIAENLGRVRQRMSAAADRAGRDPEDICLVAVTKTVGAEEVRVLYDLGVRDFGENRVMDAVPKVEAFAGSGARWHMIGHLQRNKVKKVVGVYSLIHAVDSMRLLKEVQDRSAQAEVETDVLIQVNVSGEASKFGLEPEELADVLAEVRGGSHVRAVGLMTMAPIVTEPEETRPMFRRLRELLEAHAGDDPRTPLSELSMGMTQDFEVAIEEGATLVRVGSAILK